MTDSYLLVATEATEQIFVYSRSIEEKAFMPFCYFFPVVGMEKLRKWNLVDHCIK